MHLQILPPMTFNLLLFKIYFKSFFHFYSLLFPFLVGNFLYTLKISGIVALKYR